MCQYVLQTGKFKYMDNHVGKEHFWIQIFWIKNKLERMTITGRDGSGSLEWNETILICIFCAT